MIKMTERDYVKVRAEEVKIFLDGICRKISKFDINEIRRAHDSFEELQIANPCEWSHKLLEPIFLETPHITRTSEDGKTVHLVRQLAQRAKKLQRAIKNREEKLNKPNIVSNVRVECQVGDVICHGEYVWYMEPYRIIGETDKFWKIRRLRKNTYQRGFKIVYLILDEELGLPKRISKNSYFKKAAIGEEIDTHTSILD